MGEILEACTRLLVEDTQELGLRRISLRLNEEGMEVKGPEGTQLIVISQDKVVTSASPSHVFCAC